MDLFLWLGLPGIKPSPCHAQAEGHDSEDHQKGEYDRDNLKPILMWEPARYPRSVERKEEPHRKAEEDYQEPENSQLNRMPIPHCHVPSIARQAPRV